jgi:hypothetical protein
LTVSFEHTVEVVGGSPLPAEVRWLLYAATAWFLLLSLLTVAAGWSYCRGGWAVKRGQSPTNRPRTTATVGGGCGNCDGRICRPEVCEFAASDTIDSDYLHTAVTVTANPKEQQQ